MERLGRLSGLSHMIFYRKNVAQEIEQRWQAVHAPPLGSTWPRLHLPRERATLARCSPLASFPRSTPHPSPSSMPQTADLYGLCPSPSSSCLGSSNGSHGQKTQGKTFSWLPPCWVATDGLPLVKVTAPTHCSCWVLNTGLSPLVPQGWGESNGSPLLLTPAYRTILFEFP